MPINGLFYPRKEVIKILENKNYELFQGDCLELVKDIPDKSIDLILTDPPYNISKAKWDKWSSIDEYVKWCSIWINECERILKNSGSFYFFHNDFVQMSEIQHWIYQNTNFVNKSLLTIKKTDNCFVKDLYGSQGILRNYINTNEYLIYYTLQKDSGRGTVMYDYNKFSEIKNYFKVEKEKIENTGIKIKDKVKWTKHFHSFAQGQSFGFPTKQSYEELQNTFTGYFNIPYDELKHRYEELKKEYEKEKYTFNATEGVENCLEYSFKTDKQFNHPTQKPIKLLEDIIDNSSNVGDIVLDLFIGSGSTGVAALNLHRKFIGIELDEKYFEIAKERIEKVA